MNQKITLKIQGMDCASCAAVIEHSLKKTKGVVSASVNFATEKAYLEFDSEKTNADNLKKIIKDLGYKALDEDEDEDNTSTDVKTEDQSDHHKTEKDLPAGRQDSEIKKLKLRFVLSLVFSLPVIYMVMGGMLGFPMPEVFEKYGILIQAILSTAVILASFNIWQSGFKKLLRLAPNMDSLILIGTATAYFYSLVNAEFLLAGREISMENFYHCTA